MDAQEHCKNGCVCQDQRPKSSIVIFHKRYWELERLFRNKLIFDFQFHHEARREQNLNSNDEWPSHFFRARFFGREFSQMILTFSSSLSRQSTLRWHWLATPQLVVAILRLCHASTHDEWSNMVSFRFLNPRLVDEYPQYMDNACYKGFRDEPEILCSDIPPNQFRFLGWWWVWTCTL